MIILQKPSAFVHINSIIYWTETFFIHIIMRLSATKLIICNITADFIKQSMKEMHMFIWSWQISIYIHNHLFPPPYSFHTICCLIPESHKNVIINHWKILMKIKICSVHFEKYSFKQLFLSSLQELRISSYFTLPSLLFCNH